MVAQQHLCNKIANIYGLISAFNLSNKLSNLISPDKEFELLASELHKGEACMSFTHSEPRGLCFARLLLAAVHCSRNVSSHSPHSRLITAGNTRKLRQIREAAAALSEVRPRPADGGGVPGTKNRPHCHPPRVQAR